MRTLLEGQLASRLEARLVELGAPYYHTHDSRRSTSGWPDYVIRPRPQLVLFAELKQAGKGPSTAQVDWLLALADAGLPTFLAGGVSGVDQLIAVVAGLKAGRRLMPAALGRVVVLGDISERGRKEVNP